jgi:hypothetical protein
MTHAINYAKINKINRDGFFANYAQGIIAK